MAAPHTGTQQRSDDEIVAAVAAGHEMAGMPLTAEDADALQRVQRGESTVEEERDRLLAEIEAERRR